MKSKELKAAVGDIVEQMMRESVLKEAADIVQEHFCSRCPKGGCPEPRQQAIVKLAQVGAKIWVTKARFN